MFTVSYHLFLFLNFFRLIYNPVGMSFPFYRRRNSGVDATFQRGISADAAYFDSACLLDLPLRKC